MKSKPVEITQRANSGIIVLTIVALLALYGIACADGELGNL